MVDKEIVEFIGSDLIFSLLSDLALLIGREELWGNWSIDDIV
jgi:hypothetical protein